MYIKSIDCVLHPLVRSSYHMNQTMHIFYRLIGYGLLVQDDTERRAIVAKVMEQKEIIKKASQEIIEKIDEPLTKHYIDTKVLEILTAISNIGTITDNSERFTNFIDAWKELDRSHINTRTATVTNLIYKTSALHDFAQSVLLLRSSVANTLSIYQKLILVCSKLVVSEYRLVLSLLVMWFTRNTSRMYV